MPHSLSLYLAPSRPPPTLSFSLSVPPFLSSPPFLSLSLPSSPTHSHTDTHTKPHGGCRAKVNQLHLLGHGTYQEIARLDIPEVRAYFNVSKSVQRVRDSPRTDCTTNSIRRIQRSPGMIPYVFYYHRRVLLQPFQYYRFYHGRILSVY